MLMIRFHLSSVMFFPDYVFRKAVSKFVFLPNQK